jgi:anti-anti-sigma factor
MKARIKNTEASIIISIDGKVDYETQDEVCRLINSTISKNKGNQANRNVILNFKNLEFVGSSGITQFVQSLRSIQQNTDFTPKYCGVRSEFKKIMKAFDTATDIDFYDDEGLTRRNGKPVLNQ